MVDVIGGILVVVKDPARIGLKGWSNSNACGNRTVRIDDLLDLGYPRLDTSEEVPRSRHLHQTVPSQPQEQRPSPTTAVEKGHLPVVKGRREPLLVPVSPARKLRDAIELFSFHGLDGSFRHLV